MLLIKYTLGWCPPCRWLRWRGLGLGPSNLWEPYFKTACKWALQSTILIQVHGEINETNSILGSDMSVISSASVSYSWCKLGTHSTRTICNHTFGLYNLELFHTWAVNAALAEISASNQTLPHPSLNEAAGHHHLCTPRVLQQHLLLTHSMQQSGLWAQLELEIVQEISTLS